MIVGRVFEGVRAKLDDNRFVDETDKYVLCSNGVRDTERDETGNNDDMEVRGKEDPILAFVFVVVVGIVVVVVGFAAVVVFGTAVVAAAVDNNMTDNIDFDVACTLFDELKWLSVNK